MPYKIGNFTAQQIVEKFGTATYVYDFEVIRKHIARLKKYIGVFPNTEFLYAVKANYNPTIIKEIISHDIGIDAVSPEEVKLALYCGCAKEKIMFTENNMTDAEMHEVHGLDVLLNIGSLSRLEKFGKAYPGSRVCVRFNPNVGAASHNTNITGGPDSKFGISYKEVAKVKEIASQYNLQIIGIHQHIGSGWLGLTEPLLALNVILEIAKQFPHLEFIDVGGGFGIPYKPDQTPLDIETLGIEINKRFQVFCDSYGSRVKLRFEPGRYFVAEAGHLLTQVNTLKQSISGKTIVGTDTGMHHLVRVAMYGSYHQIVNASNPEGVEKKYDVTGNICECADFFAKDRMLPEIKEGDILSIENAGAYGLSMATNYQFRALPAEVMVDGDKMELIRRRQTFEDVLAIYNS